MTPSNRYARIIERIFMEKHRPGLREVEFARDDIELAARQLGITLPKNLGDLIYSFRYRTSLPETVRNLAPTGEEWLIRPAGRARYRFVAAPLARLIPSPMLVEIKVPDATPGLITLYRLDDEQALLAKLRYNRLIDIFTGVTCYSLQSHLRTTVAGMGQVETDEVYVGVDRRGAHYVLPVQAKGGNDKLSVIQVEQDQAMCAERFPHLICRSVAAQFMADDLIALFEFETGGAGVAVSAEKHYRLVPPETLTEVDLEAYRSRSD
ncbi:MAG: endonuclease [Chloroflexi bacterium]|nr:endonuclease [Chloroflexota bacterium]